ncbi:uncharacterized protein [Fopius arisanus]|uniref:Uncharacterized protein n=1 Tax=Fopius arisanus TaxID=64838 RepID=A0A9R1TUJ6_9HYME|nr:PREDICTED: uncharacterized protein LOC105274284 [Fopius arisanus]
MMNTIQLLLLVCFWTGQSNAVNHHQCEIIRSVDSSEASVVIPSNPWVQGQNKGEFWYNSVNWVQKGNGPFTMTYKVEKWTDALFGGGSWTRYTEGTANLCRAPGNNEPGAWSKFARDLLGMSHCPVAPGVKSVTPGLLSTYQCRNMVFYYGVDTNKYKYRAFVTVKDARGYELLYAHVVLPIR